MEKLVMKKKPRIENEKTKLSVTMAVRAADAAIIEEVAAETGKTRTQVISEMVQYAYENLVLEEPDSFLKESKVFPISF